MDIFNRPKLPELKPHYTAKESTLIVDEVNDGNPQAITLFKEAFLHTDLPLAFNQTANAALVEQYPEAEVQHTQFTRETVLKDLTPQAYLEVWPSLDSLPETEGGKARIPGKPPLIGPNNEYPAATLDESTVSLKLDKYGLRLPFTIEMVINDQLEILRNYPEALAIFIRQVEDIVVAESLVDTDRSGPLASLTHVTGDPVLSIESVSAAMQQLAQVKVHGNTTRLTQAALVVPRALELLAKRITSIQTYDDTATAGKIFKNVANPAYGIKVIVFDALTTVNVAANAAATWYVVANAGATFGRPGVAAAHLRGFLTPQTFISSPNALTPAGGMADWKDGSFLNDSIEFKVRHFFGAKVVFGEGILVSAPA